MTYDSFKAWVDAEVLPLQKKNPTWERLDGASTGSNREVVARFRYAGRVWKVHGDTRIAPTLRAYDAVVDGRTQNPFVIKPTKKNVRDCLDLMPDLKAHNKPKHFYVYE